MDLRLLCNSIAQVDRHAQVDFGLNTPSGYNMLRLLLPPEEAKANFKPGAWYTLAIAEALPGQNVPATAAEIPAAIGSVAGPASPTAAASAETTAGAATPSGATAAAPSAVNDGSGSSA